VDGQLGDLPVTVLARSFTGQFHSRIGDGGKVAVEPVDLAFYVLSQTIRDLDVLSLYDQLHGELLSLS
jgi:hypothetical protein